MAALLEVLLPLQFVLGTWDPRVFFLWDPRVFFSTILVFLLGKKPSPSATPRELFSSLTHYWAGPGRFLFFLPDLLWVKMGSGPLIH